MHITDKEHRKLLSIGCAESERKCFGGDRETSPAVIILSRNGEIKPAIEPNCFMYFASNEEDLVFIDSEMKPIDIEVDQSQ